jgi:F0F1-type ATP synthase gamma subunit
MEHTLSLDMSLDARTVELGLTECFRQSQPADAKPHRQVPAAGGEVSAIVFGSDQGLVGRFNDVVIDSYIEWRCVPRSPALRVR